MSKQIMGTKRKSGIDILKIIACVFVVSIHYTEYYYKNTTDVGAFIGLNSFRWLSFSCIGLFLLATGYLQCNKAINIQAWKKLIPLVLCFLFYSILNGLVCNPYIEGNVFVYLYDLVKWNFFGYSGYSWYVNFYFAFFFFIPFLALIVNRISIKEFRYLIVILLVFLTLPNFISQMNDLWGLVKSSGITVPNYFANETFCFVYFFIGAYIRKSNVETTKKRAIVASSICVISIIVHGAIDAFYLHKYQGLCAPGQHVYTFNQYGNIFTIVSSTALFYLLKDIRIKHVGIQKTLQFLGSITFEFYLGLAVADKLLDKFLVKLNYTIDMSLKGYMVWLVGEVCISLCIAIVFVWIRKFIVYVINTVKKGK